MPGNLKRRISLSNPAGQDRCFAAHHRRHRRRVFAVGCCLAVLLLFLTVLYVVTRVASTLSDADLTTPAWLMPSANVLEWQAAMHEQSLLNTPPSHSLALHQLFFISCNRHDRSQAYWVNMAVAAQCELLSRSDRASAGPCRRLYAGQTPLSVDGGVLEEERRWVRQPAPLTSPTEVPLGACGSVFDSPAAATLRAARQPPTAPANAAPATSPPRPDLRFPLAPLKMGSVPLDAVVWLGDAIYADKRADGEDGQSLLFQHVNTLTEVGHFWRTQRDAAEYNAFIESCVAVTAAAGEEASTTAAASRQLLLGALNISPGVNETAAAAAAAAGSPGLNPRDDVLRVPEPPTQPRTQHNVWGTWDDHDMGKNDGGKEYPHRNVTQRFFLDFLKAPATDPRWTREGVYEAYTLPFRAVVDNTKGWGPSLEHLLRQLYENAVCVILLDARSFRDAPNATHAGDMLGSEQWSWFEAQLQRFTTHTPDGREPCALTLIGSGIQFMLDEKPAENWAAFPASRDRLLGLLRLYNAERVAFLTGDVHLGELGGDFTAHTIQQVLGYPLLEATSSGLTHSANMFGLPTLLPFFFPSPRRLALYVEKNFGAVRLSMDLLHLPGLRAYLNDTQDHAAATALLETPEQRAAVRDLVQRAINATFTIFSIPQHGQPVYRLNFPLSMLTYAHGPHFVEATVQPERGDVHVRDSNSSTATAGEPTAAVDPAATTAVRLRNGTVVSVAHYPTTSPTPFVTWYVRVAQRYVFTSSSVSDSLKWCLITEVVLAIVSAVAAAVSLCRRTRRPSWRSRPTTPLLTRAAEFVEEPLAFTQSFSGTYAAPTPSHRRWWNKFINSIQKTKER